MHFYYDFNLSAICVIILVILYFYTKKMLPVIQNKIFELLAWTALLSCLCDVGFGVFQRSPEQYPNALITAVTMGYFFFRNMLPLLFACYVIALTDTIGTVSRRVRAGMMAVVLTEVILIFTTPVTHLVFSLSEEGYYTRGPGLAVLYTFAVLMLVFSMVYLSAHRAVVERTVCASVYGFIVITFATSACQMVFPGIMLESLGVAFCILMIYLSIQRPDEYLNHKTGLWNQKSFYSMMRLRLYGRNHFQVMVLEIAEMEFYRTMFGVPFVDAMLKEIARFLQQLSKDNWNYYAGQSRFFLVQNKKNSQQFERIVERVREKFTGGFLVQGNELKLHAHIGVVNCPRDAGTLEELLDFADSMRKQEHQGEVQVFYAQDLDVTYLLRRREVVRALQYALEHKSFQVYYQLIYDTRQKRFGSAEALLRLTDEKLGSISPEEFIPIAEQNGMILEIGAYVTEEVCRFIDRRRPYRYGIRYIEANLSVMQCMDNRLSEKVEALLERYHVDAKYLNFEITETAAAHSIEQLQKNMELLVERGISFSMDDYGTGYSNISAVQALPLSILKIDKSVVWAGFESERSRRVLESVISMVQTLGMEIVAEGVETEEQAEYLSGLGCEHLQGFYYCRPVPEAQILTILEKNFGKGLKDREEPARNG